MQKIALRLFSDRSNYRFGALEVTGVRQSSDTKRSFPVGSVAADREEYGP